MLEIGSSLQCVISKMKRKIMQVLQCFSKIEHSYIRTIDLMQPINGVVTAAHLTIISRMLDVQSVRSGKDSYWDWAINKWWRNLSGEELRVVKEQCINQTKGIVNSLDKYGWDFNLSAVSVNRKPFAVYNGTHRCGYSLNMNPFQMIPVAIDNQGWPWSRENGVDYYLRCGMPQAKVHILVDEYHRLIENYKFDYIVLFRLCDRANLDIVKELGTVKSSNQYVVKKVNCAKWLGRKNLHFIRKLNVGDEVVVVRFWTIMKDLYFKHHRVRCRRFDSVLHDIFCMYSSTITQSMEMEIWINDCLTSLK